VVGTGKRKNWKWRKEEITSIGLRNWMYSLVVQCCRLGTCFVCLFWRFVIIFRFGIGGRVEMFKM